MGVPLGGVIFTAAVPRLSSAAQVGATDAGKPATHPITAAAHAQTNLHRWQLLLTTRSPVQVIGHNQHSPFAVNLKMIEVHGGDYCNIVRPQLAATGCELPLRALAERPMSRPEVGWSGRTLHFRDAESAATRLGRLDSESDANTPLQGWRKCARGSPRIGESQEFPIYRDIFCP